MKRVEVFAIGAVLFVLFTFVLIPGMVMSKARSQRIDCTNNLRQFGLAFKTWALEHEDRFPMSVSTTNGGSMEYVQDGEVFRHFQVLSPNPKLLICPSDVRQPALDLLGLSNSNLSYFVGVDAHDTNPQMLFTGDRNLTNGPLLPNRILLLNTNLPVGWTRELHRVQGNIGLADGSVQQFSSSALRAAGSGPSLTQRLAMP